MKIAISLPDPVFQAAEQLARRLKKSRSRLYAEAVAEYVGAHAGRGVREKLDAIYGGAPATVDPALERAQRAALPDETW